MATGRHVYIYFLVNILTRSTEAEFITGKVCVEKVLSFVKDQTANWCETFSAVDAKEQLQGETICKDTCEVAFTLTGIDSSTKYQLRKVILEFVGNNHTRYLNSYCTFSHPVEYFLIRCVSWETGLFLRESDTLGSTARCLFWTQSVYACYCKTNYVFANGYCLEGHIVIGNTCFSDLQCTGSENSGLCSSGVCSCRKGYFSYNYQCYPENAIEAGRCVLNKQCTANGNTQSKRICIDGTCVCEEGYTLIQYTCHEVNLSLNQSCIVNDQCSGFPYAICLDGKCSCIHGYIAENSTHCVLKNKVEVGSCIDDQQCKENDNPNSNRVCINGMCVCEDGYTLLEHTCLEVNLSLNQSCFVNNQCFGLPYASCLEGKCSCIKGYTAVNTTDCMLTQIVLNDASLQTENLESTINNMGPILGALFGGLLLGVFLASGIIYYMYRRSFHSNNKRKQPGVLYAVNDTYKDARDDNTVLNKVSSKINKEKQKKVLNVSPLTRSQESPEYCNTSGKQSAAALMDDVYNHLNEIKETVNENTYDHACAVSAKSQNKDLDDYSYLRGINGNTVVSGGTGDDNYSTLEHN